MAGFEPATPCSQSRMDLLLNNFYTFLQLIELVNFILIGEYDNSSDINEDGIVNILDVIQLVNIIINN